MSKNQDNYETAEEQKEAFRKVCAPLEDVRAEFEKKSVEEIKESSILELAKYFLCCLSADRTVSNTEQKSF